MPEETSKITIIADLLKRDSAYKEVIDQLEERLYNRYMVYLADKPRFNAKTQAIPKEYVVQILSFKNTLELNRVAKKYNLSQEQRDVMPAILWKIFWRDADIKNLPQIINSEVAINSIYTAYLLAGDVAQIYMPISDYLGDIPMVMKRWRYELPQEVPPTTYNLQPKSPVITGESKQSQEQLKNAPTFAPATPIVPPVRPATPTTSSVIPSTDEESRRSFAVSQDDKSKIASPARPVRNIISNGARNNGEGKDESIARVQETMARISGQMAKMQQPTKSEIEPEYLPDEASAKTGLPDAPPTHSANIIDLKNF